MLLLIDYTYFIKQLIRGRNLLKQPAQTFGVVKQIGKMRSESVFRCLGIIMIYQLQMNHLICICLLYSITLGILNNIKFSRLQFVD